MFQCDCLHCTVAIVKVAQPHLEICETQPVIDVGPCGGQDSQLHQKDDIRSFSSTLWSYFFLNKQKNVGNSLQLVVRVLDMFLAFSKPSMHPSWSKPFVSTRPVFQSQIDSRNAWPWVWLGGLEMFDDHCFSLKRFKN